MPMLMVAEPRPCMANNPAGTKLGAASYPQILSLEVVLFKGGRSLSVERMVDGMASD